MIVHWTPCGDNRPARWSQPAPDVLRCEWRGRVYEYDFSTPGVEYDIPTEDDRGNNPQDVVHKAWRETDDGPLHMRCPLLCDALYFDVTIDYGSDRVLGIDNIDAWDAQEERG